MRWTWSTCASCRRPWAGRRIDRGAVHGSGRAAAAGPDAAHRPEQCDRGADGEGRQIAPIVCVQNPYNLVHRDDDALIDELARDGIAYVPFFPLGGFTPLQSSTLSDVAKRLGATPMQVALAWLLHRAPNMLLIPAPRRSSICGKTSRRRRWICRRTSSLHWRVLLGSEALTQMRGT